MESKLGWSSANSVESELFEDLSSGGVVGRNFESHAVANDESIDAVLGGASESGSNAATTVQ